MEDVIYTINQIKEIIGLNYNLTILCKCDNIYVWHFYFITMGGNSVYGHLNVESALCDFGSGISYCSQYSFWAYACCERNAILNGL